MNKQEIADQLTRVARFTEAVRVGSRFSLYEISRLVGHTQPQLSMAEQHKLGEHLRQCGWKKESHRKIWRFAGNSEGYGSPSVLPWPREHLDGAIEVLKRHTSVGAALPEIAKLRKKSVSYGALGLTVGCLWSIFRRAGLKSPSEYLAESTPLDRIMAADTARRERAEERDLAVQVRDLQSALGALTGLARQRKDIGERISIGGGRAAPLERDLSGGRAVTLSGEGRRGNGGILQVEP